MKDDNISEQEIRLDEAILICLNSFKFDKKDIDYVLTGRDELIDFDMIEWKIERMKQIISYLKEEYQK